MFSLDSLVSSAWFERMRASFRFRRDANGVRKRYGALVCYIACEDSANELNRWNLKTEDHPRLTIVIATYKQELALDCLLASLVCQTLQNFKVLVFHDGPNPATAAVVESYAREHPARFEYMASPERFNDYGHSLRTIGIDKANTDYVLLTNGDNYYAPRFVEFMFEAIDRYGLDVAFCDMVHSYGYKFFRTRPFRNRIDLGCFMVRTSAAKTVGFRDKTYSGDATYFEDLLTKLPAPVVGKVNKVLMVHN
jgi:glycosyltransferase involved in cell wall biosynthesis